MSEHLSRFLLRGMAWGAVYLLALPVYAIRWIARSVGDIRHFQAMRSGELTCPYCGSVNPLDILATCRNCGATEFGSRLYCSHCGQVTRSFACDSCSAHISP